MFIIILIIVIIVGITLNRAQKEYNIKKQSIEAGTKQQEEHLRYMQWLHEKHKEDRAWLDKLISKDDAQDSLQRKEIPAECPYCGAPTSGEKCEYCGKRLI